MKPLMFVAVGFSLAIFASTAAKAGWQARLVDEEGGPIMQAYVEGGAAEIPADLRLQCLSSTEIGVRYGYGSDLSADVQLPADGPLTFTLFIDGKARKVSMQLEEMDGAFAAYLPKGDSLFGDLAGGSALSIDDPTGLYHAVSFTLEGSSRAIAALVDACR